MIEPRTVEEFTAYLEDCDRQVSHSALSVEHASKASEYLKRIEASRYIRQNLQMRTAGILGRTLSANGQRDQARTVFEEAKGRSASPSERASLAIRLARFYTEEGDWANALSEAECAVKHFCGHRPQYETDLRSAAGALVARGNVYFLAMIDEAAISGESDLFHRAEIDYRAALLCASHRTEISAIAATTNLACLALRSWWATGHRKIPPASIAKEMKRVCRLLRKKGIRYNSRAHAVARWLYGLASVEAYGSLNRSDENRLQRAFLDLLDLGAIQDAAKLALDLSYCYLRENRSDDSLGTTDTVLCHSTAGRLPKEWRDALLVWREAIEQRQVSSAIARTFKVIRGFHIVWNRPERVEIPKSRFGDRSDTMGL